MLKISLLQSFMQLGVEGRHGTCDTDLAIGICKFLNTILFSSLKGTHRTNMPFHPYPCSECRCVWNHGSHLVIMRQPEPRRRWKDAHNLGICWDHSTKEPFPLRKKNKPLYLFKVLWLGCYLQPKKFLADVPGNLFLKETKRIQILCQIRRL